MKLISNRNKQANVNSGSNDQSLETRERRPSLNCPRFPHVQMTKLPTSLHEETDFKTAVIDTPNQVAVRTCPTLSITPNVLSCTRKLFPLRLLDFKLTKSAKDKVKNYQTKFHEDCKHFENKK